MKSVVAITQAWLQTTDRGGVDMKSVVAITQAWLQTTDRGGG